MNDTSGEKITTFGGKLTLDLGGHTMTRVKTLFECAVPASGAYASALTVKNGTLLASSGVLMAFEMLSASDVTTEVTFENVTFAFAAGVAPGGTQYLLSRNWASGGTGTHTVDLTLDGCTVDLTGTTAGSAPFTGNLVFLECHRSNVCANVTFTTTQTSGNILTNNWNVGTALHTLFFTFDNCTFDVSGATGTVTLLDFCQANTRADITISGGKILGRASLLRIVNKTSADTLRFSDAGDGYTVLLQPAGADAPTLTLPTASGNASFVADGVTEDSMTVWRLGVRTDYGIVPPDASSANFVLFLDGRFVGSASTWGTATEIARDTLATYPGGEVTVLLRKDLRHASSAVYLCFMNGTLTLDLGGHTLTVGATLLEGAIHADYAGDFDTSVVVKNGTILAERHIMALECKNNTQKNLSVLFDGVTFAFAKEDEKRPCLISENWGGDGQIFLSMTLRDCIFDFSGATAGSVVPTTAKTVINVSNRNCFADLRIEGGRILGSLENITFCKTDDTDGIHIGKGKADTYPTLDAIAEATEGTVTSASYPSDADADLRKTPYLATDSADGRYVYLHILAMAGKSKLTLPAAADGSRFVLAELFGYDGSVTPLTLTTHTGGYEILLPEGVGFGTSDTVLRLTRGKKFPAFSVKGNLTLASDFRYHLYFSVDDAIVGAELDGVRLSLSDLERVVIDGKEYYRVTRRLAAKEGAETFTLKVMLDDGTVRGTLTYLSSIPKYAERIFAGEDETTKALMRDILSYMDAAMTYFGTEEEEKHQTIADLIGEDYDGTLPADALPTAEETVPGLYSVRLNLGATPSFRFYPKEGVDLAAFTFAPGEGILGTEVITDEEGRQCFEVTAYAYAMLNTVRYTYTDAEGAHAGAFNLSAYYAADNVSAGTKTLTLHLAKYVASAAAYRESIREKGE